MTGQINVNKIAARTGNTITIDTGDVLDVTLVKGEGTANNNLKQGLAKAYASINGQGTAATRGTFNMSSLIDNGTGNYTLGITNDMADTNYTGQLSAGDHSGSEDNFSRNYIYSLNTGNVSALVAATGSGQLYDATYFGFTIHGDLA